MIDYILTMLMSYYKPLIICFLQLVICVSVSKAQGTISDYQRSEAVDSLYRNKVYHAPHAFHWLDNNREFWYINKDGKKKEFILINAESKERSLIFDHQKVADLLSETLDKKIDANDLPFDEIKFMEDSIRISFDIDTVMWLLDLSTYAIEKGDRIEKRSNEYHYWGEFFDEMDNDPVISPDSTWKAYIKDSDVYIENRKTNEVHRLSYDGTKGEFYSSHVKWSPDSKKLMAYKVRPGEESQIFFVESSPEDQLQPKICYRDYLKPGDALPMRKPQLFLIEEKQHVKVSSDLFSDQFSLGNIEWREDSRAFSFEYNERGHQNYKVIEVEAPSGKVNILVNESSETFIDYSSKKYRYDVNDGEEIIWVSERDGWNHLYLYDGTTGKVKNQITKGEWVVREVVHVDEENRSIIFAASGMDKGRDPYLIHYFKIDFDGKGLKRLTNEDANHSATFSKDFKYYVDTYSRVDLPPVTVLRRSSDGKVIMELEEADIEDLIKTGWSKPEVFTAKGRDDKTDIWGIIIRPSNFNPEMKYPVIEYIYAGPHSSHVPKSFRSYYWSMHQLAELGFIVVQIDGMGTSNRSKAFHDVCWKNLKDAGFPDRIKWIKSAAEKYHYMDTERVGIYGGSAGGQSSTGALLFHPEFYKVGVSSCGCHDNRMDKIWWNEQWMGYPVGPEYEASSNVVNADKLEGNLMLILGELDDNVDPASTMQLADALIKADKDFELVIIPGMGHSLGGKYGERKRRDFFVKHLLDIEPPSWESVYEKAGSL